MNIRDRPFRSYFFEFFDVGGMRWTKKKQQ